MNIRKFSDKKPKVLIFQGSPRSIDSCANQISKSYKLSEFLLNEWSHFADIEIIDLAVNKISIQPCKGCISTSNGFQCHWKCSCYSANSEKNPDLMYDAKIYDKLEECDAFLVITPIHWYSVSSQVKTMFDRLVCANQTITKEQAIELFGEENIKNAEKTGEIEINNKHRGLLKNHLKGKIASFFAHGDDGANDYEGKQPNTGDKNWNILNSIMPLVYQCRYSEIICPDELIDAIYVNKGLPYYQANILNNTELYDRVNSLFEKIIVLLEKKP